MTELEFVNARLVILEESYVNLVSIFLQQDQNPMRIRAGIALNMQATANKMTALSTLAHDDPKLQASKILHN